MLTRSKMNLILIQSLLLMGAALYPALSHGSASSSDAEIASEVLDEEASTVLLGMKVARIAHEVFDRRIEGYHNMYEGHFGGGVNPYYSRTKPGYLIVEGYYGSAISKLHTPYGYLSVGGSASGYGNSFDATNKAIFSDSRMKLKLIAPGYQTEMGYYGPWYMVMSVNGKTLVEDSAVPTCPFDEKKHINKKDADFVEIVEPRLKLLNSFYKTDRVGSDEYKATKKKFNNVLKYAFEHHVFGERANAYERALIANDADERLEILEGYLKDMDRHADYFERRLKAVTTALEEGQQDYFDDLLSLIYAK